MNNWIMLTNYLNNYAQLKYYEEIAGIVLGVACFATVGIIYLVDWWKNRK